VQSVSRMLATFFVLLALVAHPVLAQSSPAKTYTISELPSLADDESVAYAINEAGQIVGRSVSASGQDHAVLWDNGTIVELGTLGDDADEPYTSQALDINEAGQVVGPIATNSTNGDRAFVWQNGILTLLEGFGNLRSVALGINDQGQVVGRAYGTSQPDDYAFFWDNATVTLLDTLGGRDNYASAINNRGHIIGGTHLPSGEAYGLLWTDPSAAPIYLGSLGGDETFPSAINEHGQVVGSSTSASGELQAFLWQQGTMVALDIFASPVAVAYDINDRGQIVGRYRAASGHDRAFLWDDGHVMDLGTLGGDESLATALNNAGSIVGASQRTPGGDFRDARAVVWNLSDAYVFEGFGPPVRSEQPNIVKAGQAIPLTWRVTDANGVPVTDLTSPTFSVSSMPCRLGNTANLPVESPGRAGVQNLGDGYYRLVWKTPKSYANSCKTLHLDLGDGVDHSVDFVFAR
jgi:probable HAF family extracellular repeat protein